MAARNTLVRYGAVAMAFHWSIAAAILFNIWFGDYVHEQSDDDPTHFAYVQIHKSIGLTILALAFLRLLWRLFDPPPPLPTTMPKWEMWASKLSHYLLYGLVFAIPLIGWAMTSISRLGIPTLWFGLFQWPHMPFLPDLPVADKAALRPNLLWAHGTLATVLLYVFAVHVMAALKHHFVDKDTVLKRMLPGTKVEP